MYARDLRRSFRVDVYDSKEDYQYNFDETFKVEMIQMIGSEYL